MAFWNVIKKDFQLFSLQERFAHFFSCFCLSGFEGSLIFLVYWVPIKGCWILLYFSTLWSKNIAFLLLPPIAENGCYIYSNVKLLQSCNILIFVILYYNEFTSIPVCSAKTSHFSSDTQLCLTLCNPMDCSTPSVTVHHQLPELAQTHVHWVGDAIQPSHPLLSPSPAFNLSQHQGFFQWVSSLHQEARVLMSFSISSSNEYSRLISFRTDWLDLLTVQGTLKSLLQHHSSKASILWRSAFFMA